MVTAAARNRLTMLGLTWGRLEVLGMREGVAGCLRVCVALGHKRVLRTVIFGPGEWEVAA